MEKEYFRFYIRMSTVLDFEPIVIDNESYTVFGDAYVATRLFRGIHFYPILGGF